MRGLVRDQDGIVHRILSQETAIKVGVVACWDWYSHDDVRAAKMKDVVATYPDKRILGGVVPARGDYTTCFRCILAALSAP